MKSKKFKIHFTAAEKYISPARLAIAGLAAQENFSVQEIQEIKNIFSKACECAIDQAYPKAGKPPEKLEVDCSMDGKKLDISIASKNFSIDLHKVRK